MAGCDAHFDSHTCVRRLFKYGLHVAVSFWHHFTSALYTF